MSKINRNFYQPSDFRKKSSMLFNWILEIPRIKHFYSSITFKSALDLFIAYAEAKTKSFNKEKFVTSSRFNI